MQVAQAPQAQKSRQTQGQNQHQLRRRRRKPLPTPPGHPSDQELIASFIAQQGIKKCEPGRAMGSMRTQALGLDN